MNVIIFRKLDFMTRESLPSRVDQILKPLKPKMRGYLIHSSKMDKGNRNKLLPKTEGRKDGDTFLRVMSFTHRSSLRSGDPNLKNMQKQDAILQSLDWLSDL